MRTVRGDDSHRIDKYSKYADIRQIKFSSTDEIFVSGERFQCQCLIWVNDGLMIAG